MVAPSGSPWVHSGPMASAQIIRYPWTSTRLALCWRPPLLLVSWRRHSSSGLRCLRCSCTTRIPRLLLRRQRLFGDVVIPVVVVMALDRTRVIAAPVADLRLTSFDFILYDRLFFYFLFFTRRASHDWMKIICLNEKRIGIFPWMDGYRNNCEIAAMGIIFRFSFYVLEKWPFQTVEIVVSMSFHTIV